MIRILSLLLVAQLALTVYLYWPQSTQRGSPMTLLTAVERSAVQSLTIDGESSSLSLSRDGADWTLDSGLPADPAKVDTLLAALLESDPGYPIANSDSASRRFEVAEDDFERRITVTLADGSQRVAFLGSSPAFRKVHARAADSDAVHVLELNSYDAPTAAADWLDRRLLAMAAVDGATLGSLRLRLEEDGWATADGSPVDAQAAADLVQALAALRVTGTAAAESSALPSDIDGDIDSDMVSEENRRLSLVAASGEVQQTLTLFETEDEQFLLRSSRFAPLFTVSSYDAGRLRDAVRALAPDAVREREDADRDAAPGES
jgi:hypothetical protein